MNTKFIRPLIFSAILSLGALLVTASCAPQDGRLESATPTWLRSLTHPLRGDALLVVGERGQPLGGAQILIGRAKDSFPGNFLIADADGSVAMPAGWTNAEPITIEAPGYVRATYLNQLPGARSFQLRKQTGTAQYEVRGVTQGHNVVDRDGFIDFGLVIPALTKNDMLTFDLDKMISKQMDTITVVGQDMEVPTNVTFPRQKETYVIPVTLEKPTYRMYFNDTGTQKVFATRGRFPFKAVVKELRKKTPFYDLVNYFEILGGGLKDVQVTKSITNVDLSVTQFDFTKKLNVVAPNYASDETMITVGVADVARYLIPTDVKNVPPGQSESIASMDGKSMLFSILKKKADMDSQAPGADRLSAVLDSSSHPRPQFLPILQDLRISADGDVEVQSIRSVDHVSELATYALLSEVREVTQGKGRAFVRQAYWEVYAPEWLNDIQLPSWPQGGGIAGKKRWEVNLIGSLNASQVELGPDMMKDATHVTHTSLDF